MSKINLKKASLFTVMIVFLGTSQFVNALPSLDGKCKFVLECEVDGDV